jgi:hypothetical protein
MGLVICPDCGNKVSDMAPACIHCGRPRPGEVEQATEPPPPPSSGRQDLLLVVGGGALLGAGLTLLLLGHSLYAGLGLLLGLVCVVAGDLWGWLKRNEE